MNDLTAVSLCAGVGGFDLALRRCGIRVVATVEIDPDCRGVLARQFPEAHQFNDLTEVTGDQLRAAGFVPERGIVCAGWPCQGNSVAGGRGGMADPRSGLWRHVVRLLAEAHPAWFIGENVPGLLSVNGGDDIAIVRRDLAQLGYWWAERVLDSQFFGVPQQRRRVFFVGSSGDGAAPVEVLLEPEGGEGHPAASREARQGAAGCAPGRTGGSGELAPTITAGWGTNHGAPGHGGKDEAALAVTAATLRGAARRELSVTGTLTAGTMVDYDDDTARSGFMVAHETGAGWWTEGAGTLRSDGGGGSGRGDHLVASTLQGGGRRGHRIDAEGAAGGHLVPLGADQISHALTAREGKGPDSDATNGFVLAPAQSVTGTITHALTSEGADASEDGTGRGTVTSGVPRPVPSSLAVRRLTPLECERLQGFPDEWTRWKLVNGDLIEQSDSARYRQIGNAVTVDVPEWIAGRLLTADAALPKPAEAEAS